MTRPSDFIINSDYLPLAQVSTEEFSASFGAETASGGTPVIRTHDFKVHPVAGAIDRVLISRNGSDYMIGPSIFFSISGTTNVTIWVFRLDASTIRVRLRILGGTATVPAQSLKIKVASFAPPNIF